MIRGLVVSDLFIYIHTYIYKTFEDLRDSFSIHMFIYFIYNQVSIYVNRRSNKTQNVKYIDDPTGAHTRRCDALRPHTYTYTHTDTTQIDPETPHQFPKPSSALLFLLTGETVRECAVCRGQ